MNTQNVFLLMGSNLGIPNENLKAASKKIEDQIGKIVAYSSVYETSAWGKTDQPNYLNQALQIETELTPQQVLQEIHAIEMAMGRLRIEKWEARLIDIDIIYFDDRIIQSENLIVPHPLLAQRRFALVPLVEISDQFVHPVFRKTNQQLLEECSDPLEVNLIKG